MSAIEERIFIHLLLFEIKTCGGKLMQAGIQTGPVSRKRLWAGRIVSVLPALFLLIDGVMKLVRR
jgi:hypothetical protein